MGKMSRDKGKAGEREVAKLLKSFGFSGARRGQQFAGGGDSPDVVGLPGFHIEVKRSETFSPYAALSQAIGDSAKGEDIPIVFHRRNSNEWIVVIQANDFLNFIREQQGNE